MTRFARWSLALTVALMPLYVVRWRFGPIPTTLLENAIAITVALYILAAVFDRAPRPSRTVLDIPIALFLLAGAIEVFVTPEHRQGFGIFRAYLVEPIALYYVANALLRSERDVDLVLAAGAASAAVYGLAEIFTFARAAATNHIVPGDVVAVLGINPNSVALYLEPLIGMAAGFALYAGGRRRQVAVALLVVLTVAELATLSRGGLLALGALAFAGALSIRVLWARVAVLAGAVAASLLLTQLPVIGPRLQHALDPGKGTFDIRGQIWVATVRMLRDHPLFGAGIDAYEKTMVPYRRAFPQLSPEPYPHNIFLTSWTELGVLGLAAFTVILAMLMVRPFRALGRAEGWQRPLLWGTGVAFAMLLVHGLVDSPYWKNDLSVEFWVVAALQVAALRAGAPAPKYAASSSSR